MKTDKLWLPYVLPFAVYMAFLTLQSNDNLLWMYPLKIIAVAGTLWYFRKEYAELAAWFPFVRRGSPDPAAPADREVSTPAQETFGQKKVRGQETHAQQSLTGAQRVSTLTLAVLIGLIVIVIWIGIDPYYPKFSELWRMMEGGLNALFGKPPPAVDTTPPFDPTTIADPSVRYAFITFRVFGAVVVVAFMEEIFWRGFLIRWLIKEDFKSVPMGAFAWSSFWITVLLFGAEHDQWLAGLICGALYNWLYYRTKDLFACVVAHAVSNAALAAWVLVRQDWKFW